MRAGLPVHAAPADTGAVRPTVGTLRPLAAVRDAIDDLDAGRIRGKAVVHVAD